MVKLIFIVIFLAFSVHTFATKEVYSARKTPSATTFAQNIPFRLAIEDGRYAELTQSPPFTDISKNLRVKLGVDERVTYPYISAYAELEVQITVTPITNTFTAVLPPIVQTLKISYSPEDGGGYKINTSVFKHSGYHKYEIEAVLITTGLPSVPLNIYLEAELEIDRYYEISTAVTDIPDMGVNHITYLADGAEQITYGSVPASGSPSLVINDHNNENGQEVEIWWAYITGAEEYELEWTWVDKYGETGFLGPGSVDLSERDFELNNTRVLTKDQKYRIPLIYNKGFLVYRIRGVGRFMEDVAKIKYGPWSTDGTGLGATSTVSSWPHYIDIKAEHEVDKNWQYQSVFAEDGKKKEIVSYFDGSLRNRQTVTKINSNNEAIVGESVYDNQGRAAIQILPTPVSNPALKYYPQLNKLEENVAITNQVPFSHLDFDWEPDQTNTCGTISSALSNLSGASKYYSSAIAAQNNWQDQVPQANGFPYTQIEYTPDNTGRVSVQSGVGVDYTINGSHATKYFYGQPTQKELNRLFGYQVGNAVRYKKNMVVDANGQVSISYLDPQGRVIATALAGDNSSGGDPEQTITHLLSLTDELDGSLHGLTITDVLAKVNGTDTNTVDDKNMVYISGQNGVHKDGLEVNNPIISVKNANPHAFTYSINQPSQYVPCATDNVNVYPFAYILDIELEDECGFPLIEVDGTAGFVSIHEKFQLNNQSESIIFDGVLDLGTSQITKNLWVDPVKLHGYALDYIENNTCVLTPNVEDNSDCNFLSGDDLNPDLIEVPDPTVYQTNELSSCSTSDFMMRIDVSPHGQYGATDNGPLSVFSAINVLEQGYLSTSLIAAKSWKNPNLTTELIYKNLDGSDSYVEVEWNANDLTYTPALDYWFQNPSTSDYYAPNDYANLPPQSIYTESGRHFVRPQYLRDASVFLENWQDSWTDVLIEFHPEYGYKTFFDDFCIGSPSSDAYDASLMQISTYADAQSGNNPTLDDLTQMPTACFSGPTPHILTSDNFFLNYAPSNSNSSFSDLLLREILMDYKRSGNTLWDYCLAIAKCGTNFSGNCNISTTTTAEKDLAWALFRTMYISEKKKIIQVYADCYAINAGYYNGYIGEVDRLPAFSGFNYYPEYVVPGVSGTCYNTGLATDPTIIDMYQYALVNKPLAPVGYANHSTIWSSAGPFASLFAEKEKRFIPIDNLYNGSIPELEGVEEMEAEVTHRMYLETGRCPLSIDVESFLNAIAESGNTANGSMIPSNDIPEFTTTLYTALNGTVMPLGQTGTPVVISTSITSNEMTITCNDAGTVPQQNMGTVKIVGSNGITFSEIIGFSNLFALSSSTFTILVQVETSSGVIEEHILNGTTTVSLTDCSAEFDVLPDPDCDRSTNLGSDLYHVFERIIEEGNSGGSFGLGTDNWYNGSELADQLDDVNGTASVTDNLSTGGFSVNSGVNTIFVGFQTFVSTSGIHLTGYSISPDGTEFIIYYFDNLGVAQEFVGGVVITGGTSSLQLNCSCAAEQDLAEALENMINGGLEYVLDNGLPANPITTPINYPDFNPMANHIISFAATGLYNLQTTPIVSDNTFELSYSFNDCSTGQGCCETVFSSENMAATSALVLVQDMEVYYDNGIKFSCYGVFEDGSMLKLFASSPSCVIEPVCQDCEMTPIQPVSCNAAWQNYNARFGPTSDTPIPLGYTEIEFCETNLGYAMAHYITYLDTFPIASEADDNYISIAQFSATAMGTGAGLPNTFVNQAISDFYDYITNHPNPYSDEVLSWNQFVADVYMIDKNICPPTLPISMDGLETTYPCEPYTTNVDIINAETEYNTYIENAIAEFKTNYIEEAMRTVIENFTYESEDKEYHYTLYYYDQAGNLTQTVPPKGVKRLATPNNDIINTERSVETDPAQAPNPDPDGDSDPVDEIVFNTHSNVLPDHEYKTKYKYNSLNQLVRQKTPDGGESNFAYDALGRLVVSQNAKQLEYSNSRVSYTVYDGLGRIVEVGELVLKVGSNYTFDNGKLIESGNSVQLSDLPNLPLVNFPSNITSLNRTEVTRTFYDGLSISGFDPNDEFQDYEEFNTRNRITGVLYFDTYSNAAIAYQSGTFYDYDVHGNVKELVQDNRNTDLVDLDQNKKKTIYDYDLVSGNVKEVAYQNGEEDQFVHRYCYDADNRITIAETSKDRVNWEKDAKYFYYDHGPLARVELGEKKVQSLDYAYTIQGWLKGVNSENLSAANDQGKDGLSTSINKMNGKDAMGYSLHYFNGDYQSRDGNNSFLSLSSNASSLAYTNLFNGNIKEMYTASTKTDQDYLGTSHTWYRYDQLNRIRSMNQEELTATQTPSYGSGYSSTYDYDKNGNLDHLTRSTPINGLIDNFTYHYNDLEETNQLTYVQDAAGNVQGGDDLADQGVGNYDYDDIGQLIQDNQEEIENIEWTVTGKVKRIIRTPSSTKPDIEFEYDAMGNRISKKIIDDFSLNDVTTFYVRDAQGNVMSTYELKNEPYSGGVAKNLYLAERNIYGSSRIGMEQVHQMIESENKHALLDINGENADDGSMVAQIVGDKYYELSNHLGNVLEVITDRKLAARGLIEGDGIATLAWFPHYNFGDATVASNMFFPEQLDITTSLQYRGAAKTVNTVPGQEYTVSLYLNPGSASGLSMSAYASGSSTPFFWETTTTAGTVSATFTATTSTTKLIVGNDDLSGNSVTFSLTNLEVSTLSHYTADIVSQSDYYPFGMLLPNRYESTSDYRYGFNGMEKDDEVKGEGNSYTTQFRQYDPRVSRWLSLDPLMAKFPHQSPYAAFNNNPIYFADPTGLEGDPPGHGTIEYGEVLDDIADIEEIGNSIVEYDRIIAHNMDILKKAQKHLNSAKLQHEIGNKWGMPVVTRIAKPINDILIGALEVEVQNIQMQLNAEIKNRNKLASLHSEEIYGLMGKLYRVGEINLGDDIGTLKRSGLASGRGFLDIEADGKLLVGFGIEPLIDITHISLESIEALPLLGVDFMVPSAPGMKGAPKKAASKAKDKPTITIPGAKDVKSQTSSPVRTPVLNPAYYTNPKGKNGWNDFLKAQKGYYSGEDWLQRASSDYLYFKSKGML